MPSKEFLYDWAWTLPATPEELWPLVSDTNRFNRDAGLPPVEDARPAGEVLENARRRLRIRVKGVTLEWEELPFEWLRPYAFGVLRRYSRGPLSEMRVRATLEPVGDTTTRLRYTVAARASGWLGWVTTPIQIGWISRRLFGRTFRRYAAGVSRAPAPAPESSLPARSARDRMAGIRARLVEEGLEESDADRLVHHVLAADDFSLSRIRPYLLADTWGIERRKALSQCLHAASAGLLDLQWDVICPRCTGAKESAQTLEALSAGKVHCDTCLIDFSTDFDQSVEVSFKPAAAVRAVSAPPFCVAGPQVTPHVEIQQLLEPGESRTVRARLVPGRHRARAWGVEGGPTFLVDERSGAATARLEIRAEGWSGPSGALAPEIELHLVNDTPVQRLIDVERIAWGDDAVTAAEVTAMSEFRTLFSSEVLGAGRFVGVGNLAVLFTDLRGSTAMYRRVGDAPAFAQVMDHFDVLQRTVAEADGAVVKTIGDAVMAVFREPADAMRAVHEARKILAEDAEPLVLKAGVHYGHSIAVTLNDRLDYFGSTVNVAARLGGISVGGDIVISDAVRDDPAVRDLFEEWGASVTSARVDVRGLDEPLRVWKVTDGPGPRSRGR